MNKLHLILATASLLGVSNLEAQSKTKTAEPRKNMKVEDENCISTKEGMTTCTIGRWKEDSTFIKRAAIGVSVQTTGTKRDTLGVFISRVTPDGPAEKAGIVEGERIASINGVDLRVAAADVEDSYAAGIASHRLTREIQKLAPGATVSLRVYSGGRIRDVSVTTARASDLMKSEGNFGMAFPSMPMMPGMHAMPSMPAMPGMPAMPAMPNVRIYRENMEPLMQLRGNVAPRAVTPMRIRVAPSTPRPTDFYFDEDVLQPTPAPSPAAAAKARVSKISRSI